MLFVVAVSAGDTSKKDKRGVFGETLGYNGGPSLAAYGAPIGGLAPEAAITSVLVEKHTAIGIPQPYAVPVEKPVPYAVKVPVPVPVDREVPVPVDRPYPVVKYVRVPYAVKVPVEVPVRVPEVHVKHVPYPVEKIIREPVYIEKSLPPVKIIVRKTSGWKAGGWGWD